jgi:hypothetical protein
MATTKVTSNLLAPSAAQTNINSGASLTLSVPTQVNNTLTTNNKVVIDSANAIANPKMLIMSTTASGAADNAPLVIKGSGVNILASINLRTTGGSGESYDAWVTGRVGGGIQVNNSFTVSNGGSGPVTGTTMFSVTTTSVGVGINTPNAAAMLDVTSTTKGFLPPRMTTTNRNAITSVPAGLVIYNTTTNNLNTYNGSVWVELVDSADLGTGIPTFLADPSSENLANALGDTNGTGPFILQDAATLTGPNLEDPIINGSASFTSTTRPTSAGTGAPAATSLMTRDDVALEPFYNLGSVFRVSATPAFANSGTGSVAITSAGDRWVALTSGTSNSGWGRAQIGRGITTVPSYSGGGINFASKLGVSIVLWLGHSAATDNLNIFRLRFGSDNTPVADGVDAVTYRGFGVEIKARGTSHDWRVYGHNGTSITYSAWSNTGLNANSLQSRICLTVMSNGAGGVTASIGINGSRTLSTISTTGGATTSGTIAQAFVECHVANSASGTLPLSAALYDAIFYAQS